MVCKADLCNTVHTCSAPLGNWCPVSSGFQITETEKKSFTYFVLILETKEKTKNKKKGSICTFYEKENHNSAAFSAANFTSLLAHEESQTLRS